MKKRARKHGWFLAALAALVVVIILGLAFSPHTEGYGGPWHIPQVHTE